MSKSKRAGEPAWFVERASDFIGAAARDPALRAWVIGLRDKSDGERALEVARVARRMREAGEDEPLVKVIESMRHPRIYEGIVRTLGDVG